MNEQRHALITGCNGFIGSVLSRALTEAGYTVWGVDWACTPGERTLRADLLNADETRRAFAAVPRPFAVIHTAAWAHGQKLPPGQSYASINTTITANVLAAVEQSDPRLVFLSSVAVYGEDRRTGPVGVDAALRPATDYGMGKKRCEELLLQSNLTHCDILRLTPVFDDAHMRDVRKRAFLPGFSRLKMHLEPPPSYSLCHVDTLARVVVSLLSRPPRGRRTINVADPTAYDQHQVASWFPGRPMRFRVGLTRPLYYLTYLLPPKFGYRLRCVYWKLMQSNIYRTSDQWQEGNSPARSEHAK